MKIAMILSYLGIAVIGNLYIPGVPGRLGNTLILLGAVLAWIPYWFRRHQLPDISGSRWIHFGWIAFVVLPILPLLGVGTSSVIMSLVSLVVAICTLYHLRFMSRAVPGFNRGMGIAYIVGSVFMAIGGIIVYAFGLNFIAGIPVIENSRVFLFSGDPNVYSPFIIPAFLLILAELQPGRFKLSLRNGAMAVLMALLLSGVMISFSRGAWANLVVAVGVDLFILAFLYKDWHAVRTTLLVVPLLAVIVIGAWQLIEVPIWHVKTSEAEIVDLNEAQETSAGEVKPTEAVETEASEAEIVDLNEVPEIPADEVQPTEAAETEIVGFSEMVQNRTQIMWYDTERFFVQNKALKTVITKPLGVGITKSQGLFSGDVHNTFIKTALEHGWLGFIFLATFAGLGIAGLFRKCMLYRHNGVYDYHAAALIAISAGLAVNALVIDALGWRITWLLFAFTWIALDEMMLNNNVNSTKPYAAPAISSHALGDESSV